MAAPKPQPPTPDDKDTTASNVFDAYNILLRGVTGSCLTSSFDSGNSGCTCSSSNAYACRNGTFYAGVACGAVFSKLGGCCLTDRENNTTLPCQQTTFCGCHTLATSFNFTFVWKPFTTERPSCADFSCDGAINTLGACCDGKGRCSSVTLEQCRQTNNFFQGAGTKCISNGENICIGGTGGCCESGVTCTDGVSGSGCISQNKLYFGASKRCYEFITDPINLPCRSALPGHYLQVGDVIEDSIVVGVYIPDGTTCYGNPIFGGSSSFASLVSGGETSCSEYSSGYDYNGYGNIHDKLCNTIDSYVVLVSLHPMSYNDNYNFTWNKGGMAYGPLISRGGKIIELQTEDINKKKEGYIFNSGLTGSLNEEIIISNSRSTCKNKRNEDDTVIERSFRNTEHNFNGRWSSDWGLHNTIRMTNAELMYESGITHDSYLYSSLYSPSVEFNSDMTSSVTGLRYLNKYTTPNNHISSWFIPSINELSFLAEQCKNNDLNTTILNNNGTPLNGEQWSSTGTFNYTGTTGEGIFNGTTADNGTYAWSINFDNEGYTIKKDARLTEKQIRPIRIIRCDGTHMENSADRLWWKVNY